MTLETSTEAEAPRPVGLGEKIAHEIRETLITIAVFVPFWLVFSTFVYELRSIPSESMVPALQVGDRVAVAKFAYGYDRNSIPFGIGRWFIKDDKDNPDEVAMPHLPKRGDVVVFQHPHSDKVMIKRLIGLPGDTIQVVDGRLRLNGQDVEREQVRSVSYVQNDSGLIVTATEYREKLPGEKGSHLIHEFGDNERLDTTPIFRVPAGRVFMMGDNRDNSEDSRAPSGHPGLADLVPEAWGRPMMLGGEQAIGYVPLDHLIGRAETVLFTLHGCRKAPGAECPKGRLWKGL